jgi:hypothetical protein
LRLAAARERERERKKKKRERKGVSAVIGVKMQLQQKCRQRLAVRASAGELATEGSGTKEELW